MIRVDAAAFFDLQARFDYVPFSQSEQWYRYLRARDRRCVFFLDREEDPQIALMGRVRHIPLIGDILLAEGELLGTGVGEEVVRDFYMALTGLRWAGVEINSNNEYSVDFEIGVRRAGFQRPLMLSACPLSIIVDLDGPLSFSRNWKYNYRKALKSHLTFLPVPEPTESDLAQFSKMYGDLVSRRELGGGLDPTHLTSLVDGRTMRLYFVKNADDEVIAGNVIYVRDEYSYDIFAANSHESLENGATRYIVQAIFNELQSEGVRRFDFGRIPPSTGPRDGVYRFKESVRSGRKIQYNGEWSFYRSSAKEYLVHLAKRATRRDRY